MILRWIRKCRWFMKVQITWFLFTTINYTLFDMSFLRASSSNVIVLCWNDVFFFKHRIKYLLIMIDYMYMLWSKSNLPGQNWNSWGCGPRHYTNPHTHISTLKNSNSVQKQICSKLVFQFCPSKFGICPDSNFDQNIYKYLVKRLE